MGSVIRVNFTSFCKLVRKNKLNWVITVHIVIKKTKLTWYPPGKNMREPTNVQFKKKNTRIKNTTSKNGLSSFKRGYKYIGREKKWLYFSPMADWNSYSSPFSYKFHQRNSLHVTHTRYLSERRIEVRWKTKNIEVVRERKGQ